MQASRLADTSDQKRGVRTGELTEQELAQLKAAKIPKGRKCKFSVSADLILCDKESTFREIFGSARSKSG